MTHMGEACAPSPEQEIAEAQNLRTNGEVVVPIRRDVRSVQSSEPSRADAAVERGDQHQWSEATFQEEIGKTFGSNEHLTEEQKRQLQDLLLKHKELWISKKLGQLNYEYNIEVQDWQPPIKMNDRRWSTKEADLIRGEMDALLSKDYIEPAR